MKCLLHIAAWVIFIAGSTVLAGALVCVSIGLLRTTPEHACLILGVAIYIVAAGYVLDRLFTLSTDKK